MDVMRVHSVRKDMNAGEVLYRMYNPALQSSFTLILLQTPSYTKVCGLFNHLFRNDSRVEKAISYVATAIPK